MRRLTGKRFDEPALRRISENRETLSTQSPSGRGTMMQGKYRDPASLPIGSIASCVFRTYLNSRAAELRSRINMPTYTRTNRPLVVLDLTRMENSGGRHW